jgi:phosphatidate phosphatase APP1
VTDREGYARFDIDLADGWPLPGDPAWEVACLHWLNREGPQCVEAFVLAPGAETTLGVISDIDDTIIETGITGGLRDVARNWRRLLAELPDERLVVPGADVFYGALGGGAVLRSGEASLGDRLAATRRPFFYVSSSPWNLFSYLVAFQKSRDLPLGPLLLRDWGLDRATLASDSHGAHKRSAVDTILATYPDMRFALIGDDTQGDLPAYAEVVQANPGRIAGVFIRTAMGPLSPEEVAGKAMIEAAGVPLWLGSDYATGRDFLRANRLAPAGDASKIVETVRRTDKAA